MDRLNPGNAPHPANPCWGADGSVHADPSVYPLNFFRQDYVLQIRPGELRDDALAEIICPSWGLPYPNPNYLQELLRIFLSSLMSKHPPVVFGPSCQQVFNNVFKILINSKDFQSKLYDDHCAFTDVRQTVGGVQIYILNMCIPVLKQSNECHT